MLSIHLGALLLGGLTLGCVNKDKDGGTDPTAEVSVSLDAPPPGSRARLVRILDITADRDVYAEVMLDGGSVMRDESPPHVGSEISAPVTGFREDWSYEVRVTVFDAATDAPVHDATFEVITEPIPEPFPEFHLNINLPEADTGDTLVPIRADDGSGYVVRIDPEGHIVWALTGGTTWWRSVRLLDDGTLLVIGDHEIVHTDWADLAPVTHEPPAGTFGYHHEAIQRPGGGFFAFTAGVGSSPNLPRSYNTACDPGEPADFWDSIVVEVDENGTIVEQWSVGARWDTHRLGWDSLEPTPYGPDLIHTNGMQYLEDKDAFLISSRNQDAVFLMSRSTGELQWILSNPWGWDDAFDVPRLTPTDPNMKWAFHHHAPSWDDGRMLLHDNGSVNDMPCGPDGTQPTRTRLVEYAIDEATLQVTETWAYEGGPFSPIMGDCDWLANGNVLGIYGNTDADETGVSHKSRGFGDLAGRLLEVDPATNTVVWDLEIREEDTALNPGGWASPRGHRIYATWP